MYRNSNKPGPLFFIAAVILAIALFTLFSCSAEKKLAKAYDRVAADPAPVSIPKKQKMAGWVAANFPIQEKIAETTETTKVLDTSGYASFRATIKALQLKKCPELNADSLIESAKKTFTPPKETIYRERTVRTKDTTGNFLRDLENTRLKVENAKLQAAIGAAEEHVKQAKEAVEQAETSINAAEGRANRNMIYVWLLIVLLIVSHVIRSRLRI